MRVLHIFWNTDMRCRHEGLRTHVQKDKGFRKRKLTMKPGDILIFFNSKMDRLMGLSVLNEEDSYGLLTYYRSPHGRVDPACLKFLPEAFNGSGFDIEAALKKSLIERLSKKRRRHVSA
jgi:hypothetical protein